MLYFPIPEGATGLLRVPRSELDLRPDAEIAAELASFRPVTSEKNVWAFWDRGLDAMYPSYRHTVLNWVRKLSPSGWTVRLVDLLPDSPNNIYNFVGREWFPECFLDKTMDGRHAAQHSSDLIRLPLLYEHGGVWMDVGNMLHTHLDELFWDALTAPGSPYEVGAWMIQGQIRKKWGSFGNFMLASRKGSLFIRNWHIGFRELWRGRTNASDFHKHPLIRDIGVADGMEDHFPDKVLEMSDYVAQMLVGDRTRNLLDVSTGWNGRDFFAGKVFMVEGIQNGILGAIKTNYDGARQAELFTTPLDEPDPKKRRAAEDFVVDVLHNSHMYKVYHNSAGNGPPALGDVVKKPGLRDADHRPGTFGELYRYGTVHWRSARGVERLEPRASEEELIRATPTTPSAAHKE